MEKLLEEGNVNIEVPALGDLIKGAVLEFGNNRLYVDLGPLGAGIIIGRELQDGLDTMASLKVGDTIEGIVINPETDDGYIELSLREAGHDKAWDELERKMNELETVGVKIMEANKGGLIVKINGVIGFLPVSQLTTKHYPRVENGDKNRILAILEGYVGQTFSVRVITADREETKLIVSEKAVEAEELQRRIAALHVRDVIEGFVSGVVDFGAFVKFNEDMEGLVHISELAWQRIDDPRDIVKVGQKAKCQIIGIDGDRISLSMKSLKEDPWIKQSKKYAVGQVVEGVVTKLNPFGAFVQLDDAIHGLAHISEFPDDAGLEAYLQPKKSYPFIVLTIEPKEHRLGLALESLYKERKAKEEARKKAATEKKEAAAKTAGTSEVPSEAPEVSATSEESTQKA